MAESQALEVVEAGSEKSLVKNGPREILAKEVDDVILDIARDEREKAKRIFSRIVEVLVERHFRIKKVHSLKLDKYNNEVLENIAFIKATKDRNKFWIINAASVGCILFLAFTFHPVAAFTLFFIQFCGNLLAVGLDNDDMNYVNITGKNTTRFYFHEFFKLKKQIKKYEENLKLGKGNDDIKSTIPTPA